MPIYFWSSALAGNTEPEVTAPRGIARIVSKQSSHPISKLHRVMLLVYCKQNDISEMTYIDTTITRKDEQAAA